MMATRVLTYYIKECNPTKTQLLKVCLLAEAETAHSLGVRLRVRLWRYFMSLEHAQPRWHA